MFNYHIQCNEYGDGGHMSNEIDLAQIKRAAHNAVPLTFKTYTLPHETEIYLDRVLESFLAELGQEKLKEPLSYCLRELAVNAKKANTKRVYFLEKGLDLNNDKEYEIGMKNFKQETFDNIQYYLQKQKELGMYIKVIFQTKGPSLSIMVRNNVEISRKEQMRVFDRLARSRAFSSLEEAFATVLDSTEGAGLGIVILVLMMKKIGLSEDCFAIDSEEGETVATLTDPVLRDPPGAAGHSHADHREGDRDPSAVPRQYRQSPEAHRGPQLRDHRHRAGDQRRSLDDRRPSEAGELGAVHAAQARGQHRGGGEARGHEGRAQPPVLLRHPEGDGGEVQRDAHPLAALLPLRVLRLLHRQELQEEEGAAGRRVRRRHPP